ncbi:Uncharacterised protein [uncultured archaeon]|nr:Uncharacterised protein [uncultured archaeon]
MKLTQLRSNHKEKFRQKFIAALAKANKITIEQAVIEYKDSIEQYIADKYEPVEKLIDRINAAQHPVLLNIRRDRTRDDKCKLCEGNQDNVDEIARKYWDRIEVIEVAEDKPEGGALYNIIFHEEEKEKKLPLTAIIHRGEVIRFWAGKSVEPVAYEIYIKKVLS